MLEGKEAQKRATQLSVRLENIEEFLGKFTLLSLKTWGFLTLNLSCIQEHI